MRESVLHSRFTTLLTATVLGVYVLIVAGATAAIADAAAACSSWPLCSRYPSLSDPTLLVAWGHRLTALLVGSLVLVTVAVGWRVATRSRVRYALLAALALYPVQVGVGAVVATTGAVGTLPSIHLAVAVSIFGALVAALAWTLESRATDDQPVTTTPEPVVEPAGDVSVSRPSGLLDTLGAYLSLTKPRLMWLLTLVASAGMALSASGTIGTATILATLGGGVLAIGASGTFNHILERDVDRRMNRTADRPLTTEQVPVTNALAFGFALTALSLVAFLTVNVLVAVLGLIAIVFYSVVYTLLLKPNTVQNTVIGGFAGALPALIGSAAVPGSIGLPGLTLAALIFLWTPAHFYNLALAYKDDYARGGFPMMPVVRGEAATRKHILWYLGATLVAATALTAIADLGVLFAMTTVALGAVFLWMVVRLHRERTESAAFRAFHASNAYLGAILVAIVVDALTI